MNYKNIKKKNIVKIPENVTVLYCNKKKILTFIGPVQTKSLKLEIELIIILTKNLILITNIPINKKSKICLKKSKFLQGTYTSKIKQNLIETSYTLYHKLNFVGVGYRAFNLQTIKNQLYFKLGYSHLIYFKIPKPLEIICIKFTKLYIFGNSSYDSISQITNLLRNCKRPEPYKGKGILYSGEKIRLKKKKKI